MIEQDGGVESVWTEMMTNSNFILNCTVDANPNNITISGTNTSMMHDNVVFQVQNNTGVFTITKAQPSNNGNYTCTASNGLESSSITYNTFIGGMNIINATCPTSVKFFIIEYFIFFS